jgi:hypothetical protein
MSYDDGDDWERGEAMERASDRIEELAAERDELLAMLETLIADHASDIESHCAENLRAARALIARIRGA